MSGLFFEVHQGLDREGPGTPEDVLWALDQIARPARVLDAGCGPGADTYTLAMALPDAQIRAVDAHAPFVHQAAARVTEFGPRVTCEAGDMFAAQGPFDLIWCAGAIYFAGVQDGLRQFSGMLSQGGHIAFSEPNAPGPDAPDAAHAFWADYPGLADHGGVLDHITAAGFTCLAHRPIMGAPWAAYYDGLQSRIDQLKQTADENLRAELGVHQREIDQWRAAPDHIAYGLYIVTAGA